MKKQNPILSCLFLAGFVFIVLACGGSHAQTSVEDLYVLQGGTIHTVTMGTIEGGMILIRDGIIEQVGQDLEIPPGAQVIMLDTLHVYPGFIDAHTEMALAKPKRSDEDSDSNQSGERKPSNTMMSPERNYAEMLNPKDSKIKKVRETGVTTALTAPETGIFIGRSCLINLGGDQPEAMILSSPAAFHMGYERQRGVYPSTLMAVIAFQRQTLLDAQHHQRLLERYAKQKRGWKRPVPNRSLESLFPILENKMPVVISADRENEMKRAFKLIDEFALNAIISGAVEGWHVIDQLNRRNIPVLLSLNFPKPEEVTGYAFQLKVEGPSKEKSETSKQGSAAKMKKKGSGESAEKEKDAQKEDPGKAELYANAGKLYGAGVEFAFSSGGLKKPEDFIAHVKKTVDHGLPKDAALKALTLNAARILGVDEQIGSIEAGKIANFAIMTDDLFSEDGKVRYVFVDGKKYEVKEKKKAEGAPEVDVTGTWEGAVFAGGEENAIGFSFKQDGGELSGTLEMEIGEVDITEGSVAGHSIDFTVELMIEGQKITFIFTGTVEGDEIEGSLSADVMGSGTWKVTKTGGPVF